MSDDKIGTADYRVTNALISQGIDFFGSGILNIFSNFTPHAPTIISNVSSLTDQGSGYTQIGNTCYWFVNFNATFINNATQASFGNLPKIPNSSVVSYINVGKYGETLETSNPLTFMVLPNSSLTQFLILRTFSGTQLLNNINYLISGTIIYNTI